MDIKPTCGKTSSEMVVWVACMFVKENTEQCVVVLLLGEMMYQFEKYTVL